MKHGRIAYKGQIHHVVELEGRIQTEIGSVVNEEDVVWLPPVVPSTIFALGLNYADHASELSFKPPEEPLLFLKGPNTLVGHKGETIRPSDVTFMHYECELAVVIGRSGRNIKQSEAYDYIAGYTIANDYAFRDYLENYYRPNFRVKNRDMCTPIGPWMVDKEDIKDPMNLKLYTYVNGKKTQEGSTKNMIFSIPFLIEYLSGFMTLNKNDLILTGTPKGAVDTKVGDVIVTEIEGIGKLENTIIAD
ncbi:fumarylacetoacetate hydrolase family protein [Heyndrickxia coagulans]|uniref:fumarylacetoacetate hydrolase family protein n=1 Tax=Heyndrickxia TaxID=2837504 RepID=UPI0007790287|nr:fumarylacetoacetate hydrolase family protein [Heyndrickxia coagulans]KYC62100.1 5-carboxymethyl-2-oxo-hex-3- ene-1,7-dioate decarboxylase [Heyndrickxia coagulans]